VVTDKPVDLSYLFLVSVLFHNPFPFSLQRFEQDSRASRLDAPPCLSRLDGMAGRRADPVIISTFPGSPALWAGSFSSLAKKAIDIITQYYDKK
jgi:hypothetical protein